MAAGNTMGRRKSQMIHVLRHGEELVETGTAGDMDRQLPKDASSVVINQQHQQRGSIGAGVQPTIAVMQQSQIPGDQNRSAQLKTQTHRERQGAIDPRSTTETEATPIRARGTAPGEPVPHR